MRFKAASCPTKPNPIESRVDSDAHVNGWSGRNQQFLSYFLSRYGQRRTIQCEAHCSSPIGRDRYAPFCPDHLRSPLPTTSLAPKRIRYLRVYVNVPYPSWSKPPLFGP
ncbi:hypothetical protein FSB08_11530 [Paraburkholderia sp. JPY432]|nr:hypothetical protein [Paraburkholderia youngii]